MTLIRCEPVAELDTIQSEMNRLFNNFFDTPAGGGRSRRWLPAMDLFETAEDYVLRADLPGLSDQDVNVQLEDNVLTISGERKTEPQTEHQGYHRLERAFGGFSRSLTLPNGIDPESVHAHFDRGVLEVTIPKPEQKKPRRVQIKLGSDHLETIESTAALGDPSDPRTNSHEPVAAMA